VQTREAHASQRLVEEDAPFWAASNIHATSEIDTAIACQLEEIGG
jgi:hypothetical protein